MFLSYALLLVMYSSSMSSAHSVHTTDIRLRDGNCLHMHGGHMVTSCGHCSSTNILQRATALRYNSSVLHLQSI